MPNRIGVVVTSTLVPIMLSACGSGVGSAPQHTTAAAASSQLPVTVHTAAATPSATSPAIPALTGIGATTAQWDASHTPNPFFDNGRVYANDPTLPSYLANHGAVYIAVQRAGDRIVSYDLNTEPAALANAIERVRRELPPDATLVWTQPLDTCYRVNFESPTLTSIFHASETIELVDIGRDGANVADPGVFNQAEFMMPGLISTPDPSFGC